MQSIREILLNGGLFIVTMLFWRWTFDLPLADVLNLLIIIGGVLLVFPVIWLGRKALDGKPTLERAKWITAFVHFALMNLLGAAILRAIMTHQDWPGWTIPLPTEIGRWLVIITSIGTLLTVANLALKGLGAPFAIALSQKLAMDWLYAWTRNPMVLGTLACLISLGLWFQSTLFVLWALLLVTPAWLAFVKVYEERELEIRFGAPYLAYKAKTPLLFPRKPLK